jgi:osmotically inducible lipoprotein OsmB
MYELSIDEINEVSGAGTADSVMTDAAAGALAGAAIGFFAGGPIGAIAGAISGGLHAGVISFALH